MKEPNPDRDPFEFFADDDDSGEPLGIPAGLESSSYRARPGEVAAYASSSGSHTLDLDDAADDWPMAQPHASRLHAIPARYVETQELPERRGLKAASTFLVCALLGSWLILERPDFTQGGFWRDPDVIELPAIAPPPLPSRLPDEPGRIAAATPGSASRADSPPPVTPADDKTTGSDSAATTSAAPAAPAAIDARRSPAQAAEVDTILGRLDDFQAAYSARDTAATKRLWPTVDAGALERVFRSISSHSLELSDCQVSIRNVRAHAVCIGRTRTVPNASKKAPRVESRQWVFDLSRSTDGWEVAALNLK